MITFLALKNRGTHLYVVNPRMNCLCGATGNCPIELVEENAGGVRRVAGTIGWGFYAYPHQDSPYPDIFIPSHVSCCEISVVGYSNVAGEWGQLYCGKIVTDGGQQETDDVQVCH